MEDKIRIIEMLSCFVAGYVIAGMGIIVDYIQSKFKEKRDKKGINDCRSGAAADDINNKI